MRIQRYSNKYRPSVGIIGPVTVASFAALYISKCVKLTCENKKCCDKWGVVTNLMHQNEHFIHVR